jgi:hypothetical protein
MIYDHNDMTYTYDDTIIAFDSSTYTFTISFTISIPISILSTSHDLDH